MYSIVKRTFDIISSLMLLTVISPLFIAIIIAVWYKHGYPVFFTQTRTGKNMKEFKLIKFRSMSNETDKNGVLLPDHDRVTPLGRFLRSSSLDELPELINIIRGEMSVIGPRPLPPKYDSFYRDDEKSRFKVRGGLITPDSIDSEPIISWDKQFEYEADYGNNLSLKKDLKIFLGVFRVLFKRNHNNYGSFERKSLIEERSNFNQSIN